MAINFIDCTSLNISYDVMGIATITYTIASDTLDLGTIDPVLEAGGQTFTGIVTEVSVNQIPNSTWYDIHVSMLATNN